MTLLTLIRTFVFSFFLFIYALLYVVTTDYKDEQIEFALENQIQNLENNYKVVTNRFELISGNFYTLVLNQPEILKLLYRAKHSTSDKELSLLRQHLYTKVKPSFEHLKKSGVNIILFAFEDNHTFLRVHKPDKYGDDLSSTRYSFTYTNANKKSVKGFEQGKISHAFRNVFPLFYQNEYLGSVDISFSSEVLQENMTLLHGINTHFIIDKILFDANIWKAQKTVNYTESIENENFLFALTASQASGNFIPDTLVLNDLLKKKISQNIQHHGPFALYQENNGTVQIITFFPIQNIKDKKTVAYLVSYTDSYHIESVLSKYVWSNVLFFIGLLVLSFIITNNIRQRYFLEVQIQEAIEKNRLQDKKLLEQSEIAQEKLNKSIILFGENVISSNSDTKGIITYASQALCRISGYTSKELIGKPHSILRHPDMPSETFEEMWQSIKAGKTWDGEVKNRKKNGESYWVRTSIMPECDDTGNIIGYVSIRHEITSQKVKEEFMANMSHELRTPLNAIIGFSGILKEKLKDSIQHELIKQIATSASSLLMLINDILDLSKIQNSKFTIESYEFNAYHEIVEYSKNFNGLTAQKDLKFVNVTSENLHGVFFGDWMRISQIILNLVSNAIKFTHKNGEINFVTDYTDHCLVLSITDNGIGMNKETQDRIFKPFEQADGSTTRRYGGTGLGLSITQSLVELMNGKIELESQEGVGSTFKVTIPLKKVCNAEKKETIIESNETEADTILNAHVLVVEDNLTNQLLTELLLKDIGITCDIANDGLEAVDIYNPSIHALVLMDENMPNMNGLEAMKILKEKYQDKCTPIIALTANAMEGDRERFLKLGMDGYIAKPIDEKLLLKTIKELL